MRGRPRKGKKQYRVKLKPDTYEKLKLLSQELGADIDQTLRFMEGVTTVALLTLAGVSTDDFQTDRNSFSDRPKIIFRPTENHFQTDRKSFLDRPILILYFQEVAETRERKSSSPYGVHQNVENPHFKMWKSHILDELFSLLSQSLNAPVHRLLHRLLINNLEDTTKVVSSKTFPLNRGKVVNGDLPRVPASHLEEEEKDKESFPIAKEKSPTERVTVLADENDLQSQEEVEEGCYPETSENTPDRVVVSQGVKDTKIAKEGEGLGESASPCLPTGVERHRKRIKEKVKKAGKKWDIDQLMEIVETWEVMYGEWKDEWDEVLIELRSYFSPQRIEKMISSSTQETTKGNFGYFASIPLKQIASALKQGKEEARTAWGKVKVVKKGAGVKHKLSPADILKLWNEKAKEEKLMLASDAITPVQKEILLRYIAENDSEDIWKKIIDTVPVAIAKTQRSEEPRSFAWLFRQGRDGSLILEWVMELATTRNKVKSTKKFTMRARLEKFLSVVAEAGIERDTFKEFLKRRSIRVEKDRMSADVIWFIWPESDEEFTRLHSLISANKLEEARDFLKEILNKEEVKV